MDMLQLRTVCVPAAVTWHGHVQCTLPPPQNHYEATVYWITCRAQPAFSSADSLEKMLYTLLVLVSLKYNALQYCSILVDTEHYLNCSC